MKTLSFPKLGFCVFLPAFMVSSVSCMHHHKHRKHKEGLAVIKPVNKSQVQGWVRFQKKKGKKIWVTAEITGLSPNKEHGFHIHEYGDCREDGQKAGAHWNPKDKLHGSPDSKERHLGDLGNLKADSKGRAVYQKELRMCGYKKGFIGRSIIIHAKKDDLKSQPTGQAGPYVGCGIIGKTKRTACKKEGKSSDLKPKKVEVQSNKPQSQDKLQKKPQKSTVQSS